VDLLAQTKKVMVEQKAADILLQAKLLELDAARMLVGLNPQRVEKPSQNEQDGEGNDDASGQDEQGEGGNNDE